MYQLLLEAPWDLKTLKTVIKKFNINDEEPNPTAMTFAPDGTHMYVIGQKGIVYEYTLPVPWNVYMPQGSGTFFVSDLTNGTEYFL